MKKAFTPLLIMIIAITFVGCEKEDKIEEDLTYTLIVKNTSSKDVDVYVKNDLGELGFTIEGTVSAGGEKRFDGYVIDVNYILRATVAGDPEGDYFDEQAFKNSQPDKFDLTITITEN